MRTLFLAVFVLGFVGSAGAQQHAKAPETLWERRVEQGYEWMGKRQCQQTLDSCRLWLRSGAIPMAGRAGLLNLQGNALRRLGRAGEATALHRKALDIRTELYGAGSVEVAKSCQNLFNCYWDLGDYENAALFAQRNLSIREKLPDQKDAELVVWLMNLADALLKLNRPSDAEPLFQKALKTSAPTAAGHDTMSLQLLQRLASCFYQTGQYYRSLDTLERVWAALQTLPQASLLAKGKCLALKADCLFETGDAASALHFYRSALNHCSGSAAEYALMLLSLARLHRYLYEMDKAIEYLKETLSICKADAADPRIRQLHYATLLQFGSVHLEKQPSDIRTATQYFKRALAANTPALSTSAHLKLGRCHLRQGDFAAATSLFDAALKLSTAHPDPAQQFAAHYFSGEVAFLQKNYRKAASRYGAALQSLGGEGVFPYETIQAKAALCLTHQHLAARQGQTAHWRLAKKTALEGVAALEALKGRLTSAQSEIDVQDAFFQLFNVAIEATLALQEPGAAEEAFVLTERYRGNLFRKLATQAQASAGSGTEEKRLQALLADAEQRRFEASHGSAFPLRQKETERLDSLILACQQQLSAHQRGQLWSEAPVSSAAVRKALRKGQTLIEFHWGEGQLFVFLLRQDTFLVKTLPAPEQLTGDIRQFFMLCRKNPLLLPAGQQLEFPALAHRLYAQLIAPLKPWLTPELTIVPDAALHYLPFEALLTSPPSEPQLYWKYRYLVQSYSIGYAHAASAFTEPGRERKALKYPLLALAPGFEGDTRQELSPLAHNEAEALLAKRAFGGRLLHGKLALKHEFLALAANSRILLFSTHGVLDDRNAAWSYLAFTEMPDSLKNEYLFAWEIHQLSLDAELVILSACQTAIGHSYRGEGLISLARAFQFAGAKTVVATLWNVNDEQTSELMAYYFENLSQRMPKSIALTEAKRRYLAHVQSLKTHPFFWSGFISIGSDEALQEGENGRWRMPALVALSGLGLVALGMWGSSPGKRPFRERCV